MYLQYYIIVIMYNYLLCIMYLGGVFRSTMAMSQRAGYPKY